MASEPPTPRKPHASSVRPDRTNITVTTATTTTIMRVATIAALLSARAARANPVPAAQDAPLVAARHNTSSSCTFTGAQGYADVVAAKTRCADIVLASLQVPGGVTLDLEGLRDGTTVTFAGTTTWGFAEWAGSLVSVSGTNVTVRGAPGAVLDGRGALWWDGLGNGGGKTKPKFFKANNCKKEPLLVLVASLCCHRDMAIGPQPHREPSIERPFEQVIYLEADWPYLYHACCSDQFSPGLHHHIECTHQLLQHQLQ